MITIFLGSLLVVPSVLVFGESNVLTNIDGPFESQALLSQIPHNARVAIYDEDNVTTPAYSGAYYLTNNITEITTLLESAGHSVEALTEEDILNHELITAAYDVFIIVNNVPRPSIINYVKEFWMGGGGLLSFNSAISYLCYAGILDPTSSDDGSGGFMWTYGETGLQNITARHPTMKDYHVNDTVSERTRDWVMTSTLVLDNIDIYSNPTGLISDYEFTILVTAFALDQCDNGGRVVHLPGDGYSIPTDFESIIVDSVEWLTPKPKGRVVYDLTHSPRLSVDIWDYIGGYATAYSSTNSYNQFRALAVNHTFTFDKLYPSAAGNFTAERLDPYDVLMLCWPDLNYTAAEMAVVEDWVSNGGSLLVLGDRYGLGLNPGDLAINELLQNFDMSLGTTNIMNYVETTPGTHYTLEGCDILTIGFRNHLVVLSNATGIWYDGAFPVVAAQEFGDGRAILSADMNIFDNGLLTNNTLVYDNQKFALNVLNWLTSNDANILVYASYGGHYADVITALRDLGHSYQPFFTDDYIDDFIDSKEWDLVILDQSNYWFTNIELDALYAYVNDGGRLILSYFDVDGSSTHPIWSKIGVEYSAEPADYPDMFMWDSSHRIFTEPNNLDAANLTSDVAFGDDGDTLTVLDGYTALAGSTATEQGGNAFIVLSNDYQTLYNGYLIDACTTDEDDSTYRDSVELWQNEIAFMLNPPSGGFTFPIDLTTLLIIGGVVVGIIVIGALAARRRGGGSSKPKKKPAKKKKK
ncbi:MAG: hypothetical protein ACFFBL_09155 [Promethearchaeota archaeon]